MGVLTAILFALTFLITLLLVSRSLPGGDAVIERVLEKHRRDLVPVSAFSHLQVLARFGKPERGQARERLRKRFLQAGIRAPAAETLLSGIKTAGAAITALVAGAVTMLANAESSRVIMASLAGLAAGYILPDEILKLMIGSRRKRIEKALPNALDLLTICVEAGLGLDQAIVQVSRELGDTYPEISDELGIINLEMRAGKRRADCLRAFGERTGVPEVKKLAAVLIQADRFGTSIAQSLRVHSEHLRIERRQLAEEKAAKLGVKLVFPIFFFILPSLFVVTVGPVLVRIFRDLLPMLNHL